MLAEWDNSQIVAQLDSGYRWRSSTISYTFAASSASIYAASGEATGFSPLGPAEMAAATLALSLWDDLIAPDLVKIGSSANSQSADIELGMSTTGIDYAHAYYPSQGSVWFNSTYRFGTNKLIGPTIGQYGFETYIHETGHAFGLDHMGDYNGQGTWQPSSFEDSSVYSVMSYFGPDHASRSDTGGRDLVAWADWVGSDGVLYSPQTPMLSDVLAIQSIYGADTTTRTDDTTYGFHSTITGDSGAVFDFTRNLHPILTIYDSAGTDTLDLSGWETDSIIDLRPGAFSSANAMTDNIAIAYGASIEDAIGGAGADTISGNVLDNLLIGNGGNDSIYAGLGNDSLFGGDGDDVLFGMDGRDRLFGGNGADLLDGGDGDDRMSGGTGDDVYVVDSFGDAVIEAVDAGYDVVKTTLTSLVMPDNIEQLQFAGDGDVRFVGNSLANAIIGGDGDDWIDGGAGGDVLWGLDGHDRFVFSAPLEQGGIDAIVDFNVGDDLILLSRAVFGALGGVGSLDPAMFGLGNVAAGADERILYNTSTGGLFYDDDGWGDDPAVQFAAVTPNLALTASNLIVI